MAIRVSNRFGVSVVVGAKAVRVPATMVPIRSGVDERVGLGARAVKVRATAVRRSGVGLSEGRHAMPKRYIYLRDSHCFPKES